MKRKRKGFTLVEILVVIVIITMLATLITPNIFRQFAKAKVGLAKTGIALIETAMSEFYMDCNRFPNQSDGGLDALLVAPPALIDFWDGPYVREKELYDPWGYPLMYQYPSAFSESPFDIFSYGADGQPGGEGPNADIYNT